MTSVLAVPSELPGGPTAAVSAHFGHCEGFSLFVVADGQVVEQALLPFPDHEHGDCLVPVRLLAERGVTALAVAGMGRRPLAGFLAHGIQPYAVGALATVGEVTDAFLKGELSAFALDQACSGHGSHGADGACNH